MLLFAIYTSSFELSQSERSMLHLLLKNGDPQKGFPFLENLLKVPGQVFVTSFLNLMNKFASGSVEGGIALLDKAFIQIRKVYNEQGGSSTEIERLRIAFYQVRRDMGVRDELEKGNLGDSRDGFRDFGALLTRKDQTITDIVLSAFDKAKMAKQAKKPYDAHLLDMGKKYDDLQKKAKTQEKEKNYFYRPLH